MGKESQIQASRKLIVPNRMEEIRTITAALEEFFEQQGLPPEALFNTQLSLEEIFTNVASYAHDDDQEHEVEIILSREGETITVEILDDGSPFNPLEDAPELDVESSLEDRGIGGAGIMLAKQLMTELRYRRNSDRNHLTMIKKI
ncbi:MAG: ATP-binding protein [Candidatus Dadabacteria bacterium]|nr:ATP-binding protein [Candidatus Dadabacteria bacterium]MYA48117.1 ATP-binding protein [Candidatus Dadabacteria bacterium]MYF48323.1 ATP-binding protein [Candidatus Dadabacteria bacterium]MYK49629.1 ATP-binding protein [Candidatus Dadabacteria bacterium]